MVHIKCLVYCTIQQVSDTVEDIPCVSMYKLAFICIIGQYFIHCYICSVQQAVTSANGVLLLHCLWNQELNSVLGIKLPAQSGGL